MRDVISAEMWEAVNTTNLQPRRGRPQRRACASGPYSVYGYVKERCALFWGLTSRTMLRDEASAFLAAGGRIESADMVLRMLRVALPPGVSEPSSTSERGQALALLQAVGGFQAYRRAVPAPPNALPVARFLLFERTYPDSVAASVDAVHNALYRADGNPRNSEPVLRLQRLSADLEFRGRAEADGGDLHATCEAVQEELVRVDRDIADRYFAGARRHHGRRMNFAIRYLTEYRYDGPVTDNLNALRVRPATTSTQRVDDFHVRVDPEARLHRHLDYFGTEVIEFGVAQPHDHLSIDVRARVVTAEPGDPPDERLGGARGRARYEAAGGEFLLADDAEPENGALDELFEASRATSAAGDAAAAVRARSPTASSTARARPTSARRSRTCSTPAPASARTSSTSRSCCCAATGSPPATSPATCGRRPATAARTRSRSTPTPGSRRCCPAAAGAASRSGSAPIRPTAGWRARRHVKIGHGRPTPTCRRSRASTAAPGPPTLDAAVTMTRLDPQASARA